MRVRRLTCCDRVSGFRNACRNAWKSGKLKGESEGFLLAIGSSKTCGAKRRYARQNKKKGSKRIETADLLRSVFQLKKRLKKRLIVGKSERGERELSVDYKIVDNERQEEKMCDPRTHGATAVCEI